MLALHVARPWFLASVKRFYEVCTDQDKGIDITEASTVEDRIGGDERETEKAEQMERLLLAHLSELLLGTRGR